MEELAGLASRINLARAQLVSSGQQWNVLVERVEFYKKLEGEQDDNQGGGDDDDDGEREGGVTLSDRGGRSQGQWGELRRSYNLPSSETPPMTSQLGHEDGGSGDVGLGPPLVAPCRGEADTIIKNKCS